MARAWTLKEQFRAFWAYTYRGAARTFCTRWFWRTSHSRLKPMAGVPKLIQRHLPNLLTYLEHGLTNAGLEAINGRDPVGEENGPELPQPPHFHYFHCGGLDESAAVRPYTDVTLPARSRISAARCRRIEAA